MDTQFTRIKASSLGRIHAAARTIRGVSMTAAIVAATLLFLIAGMVSAFLNQSNSGDTKAAENGTVTGSETQRSGEPLTPQENEVERQESMKTEPSDDQGADVTSPGVRNESSSSTTVTVNGESVTVPEGESYHRSYDTHSSQGNSHVEIHVENNSSSDDTQSSVRSRERTRLEVRTENDSSIEENDW